MRRHEPRSTPPMNIQLTFRGFSPSDGVRHHVEDRATKLLGHDDGVISLRVALEAPHHHHHHGHAYRVRIEVMVPGADVAISPRDGAEGHTDLHAAIDDAFIAAGTAPPRARAHSTRHCEVARRGVASGALGVILDSPDFWIPHLSVRALARALLESAIRPTDPTDRTPRQQGRTSMTTILVAVDGSARAPGVFKAAAGLARALKGRAVIYRALEDSPDFAPPGAAGVDPLPAYLEGTARTRLMSLAASAPDVQCEFLIEEAAHLGGRSSLRPMRRR